jgi:hypothetical protein
VFKQRLKVIVWLSHIFHEMSYLNPLRLHFSGRFQANPSTVNNDPLHFDNATFKSSYQERQSGNTPETLNGWFNPSGDASWRLIGCRVTAAWLADGTAAGKDDPISTYRVADSDDKVSAKLADLDPEQQLVSEIWGMEVRMTDSEGKTLLRGKYQPAAFMDIWDRAGNTGGDIGGGAMFQSVLSELEWGDIGRSEFLQALQTAAKDGLLSIKFNVDGVNLTFNSPEFMRGRIVGTIGPATADEPRHFVLGRQFMTTGLPSGNFFAPAGKINFCVATVNDTIGKIFLDLGNALPTAEPGGAPMAIGTLSLVCEAQGQAGPSVIQLGEINYSEDGWYERTASVIELPSHRRLTVDELDIISQNPLALQLAGPDGQPQTAINESPGGLFVRADRYVFRLSPGETAHVRLYATQFGTRYGGARILAVQDPTQLQPQAASPLGQAPPVGTPIEAIDFPARVVADPQGVTTLPIRATDPGNPRGYIDGQVYGIRPVLEETVFIPRTNYPFNQWNFISILVWNAFHPDEPPTWYGSMEPIFQQNANLYPVMKQFLDLADYDAICANRRLLLLAFGLDVSNPNSMPVTRDLSPTKRYAILRWLNQPGPDGNPLKGKGPPAALRPQPVVAPVPSVAKPVTIELALAASGKASAARRRLGFRRSRV